VAGFLLDTNVVSELFRRDPDAAVARWWRETSAPSFLSVLVLGELRRGVERLTPRDPARAAVLDERVSGIARDYLTRTLPVTAEIADVWGRMSAQRVLAPVDGLLAATASVHGLTLATRNVKDIRGLDVPFVDPFIG
jgi:hypothetical protein